jgi:3'(2'), 5'-bisphosphate nucleotidase
MINEIIQIAQQAGEKIMDIRRANLNSVRYKADASPVTEADLASNEWIVTRLEKLGVAPIVSEETSPQISVPDRFWIVDPLDGTKDYVAGKDTFVVNIALIDGGYPVLGVIHAPALGETYWAQKGQGAFKSEAAVPTNPVRITNQRTETEYRVLASGSQTSERMQAFLDELPVSDLSRYGSALKMCRVAEGAADLYPRFGDTHEWDTAPGQIILEESRCKLVVLATGERLKYGKPTFLNPGFIASRADLDFKLA